MIVVLNFQIQRYAVDDDKYSNKGNDQEETSMDNLSITATSTDENDPNVDDKDEQEDEQEDIKTRGNVFDPANRLSCKWASGVGPRIGCVRDYPMELQFKALEKMNLSPNNNGSKVPQGGPSWSNFPIPSPRPSPRVRMSPRLAYMGLPSPRITAPLQN